MPDEHTANMVNALTERYVDQGRIIEAGWQGFALMVLSPAAPAMQRVEMRKAFFAGAQHLFGSIASMMSDGDDGEPTADDLRRMALIDAELSGFVDELKREIVTHRSLPETCPYCGKVLDADTEARAQGGGGPKPGDVGICWGCLRPLVFDENRHRRKPTLAEVAEIDADPVVQEAIARAKAAR